MRKVGAEGVVWPVVRRKLVASLVRMREKDVLELPRKDRLPRNVDLFTPSALQRHS